MESSEVDAIDLGAGGYPAGEGSGWEMLRRQNRSEDRQGVALPSCRGHIHAAAPEDGALRSSG